MLKEIKKELDKYASPEKAAHHQRFFKTGKGQYGEGDIFLGVTVPNTRKVAAKFNNAGLDVLDQLIRSKYHEHRFLALIILVNQYPKAEKRQKEAIFRFYLDHMEFINNWDLVDVSAYKIIGPHLENRDKTMLVDLAGSSDLWQRRIAMLSCFHYIRKKEFSLALSIADILKHDSHDLIHKAVGWMLREIGKRDLAAMKKFLDPVYKTLPRTMLRYAIEKLPQEKRQKYLKGEI